MKDSVKEQRLHCNPDKLTVVNMSAHHYHLPESSGIRRIQQACLSCRRKKSKCSGERPVCGHCKRLRKECHYWSKPRTSSKDTQESNDFAISDYFPFNNDDAMSGRVEAIETKLDQLINSLNVYLPAVVKQSVEYHFSRDSTDAQSGGSVSLHGAPSPFEAKGFFDQLPPPTVLNSMINVYFTQVHNQPYSLFHEQTFREKMTNDQLPKYLLFAVLASAVHFSDDDYFLGASEDAGIGYARASWTQIVSVWLAVESDPNLHICQAITLLSIIDFTAGRRHPAWLKIGLSIRIAQDLRLMLEPDAGQRPSEQEENRRVFWSIYILDRLCSCGRARPASINDAHCGLQLPCGEAAFKLGIPEQTQNLKQAFSLGNTKLGQLGHFAIVVLTASVIGKFAHFSNHEHNLEVRRLPPWDSKSDFTGSYSVLLQLESQRDVNSRIGEKIAKDFLRDGIVDRQMAGPFIFSHALFHLAQCLLHHPILLYNQSLARGVKVPASFHSRALKICRESALAISNLVEDTRSAGYPIYYSIVGYCVAVSAGIHILHLSADNESIRQRSRLSLQSDISYLRAFSGYWKNGNTMLSILHEFTKCASLCSCLITTSPRMEKLDPRAVETLWSAVDYSSMSQISLTTASATLENHSQLWYSLFETSGMMSLEHEESNAQEYAALPSAPIGDSDSFRNLLFEKEPFLNFFFGEGPLNFGG